MLRIIIAVDDPAMRFIIKQTLNDIPGIKIVGETETGRQLFQMVEKLNPNIIFLDIDMPELNGIEVAKKIFEVYPNVFFIFTTSNNYYIHEAFEVYALDYLIKPFKLDRIRQTIERFLSLKLGIEMEDNRLPNGFSYLSVESQPKLKIQSNGHQIFVNVNDIILITREDRRTMIYSIEGAVVQTYENLQSLEERLRNFHFFRCHKGFIINSKMVVEIFPWGKKTYGVKLSKTKKVALMTQKKVKEYQDKYNIV